VIICIREGEPGCTVWIDDATSKFWARFTERDSTEENLRTLGGWLRHYGRPLAHYTDKNSIFRSRRRAGIGEQLQGEEARSQFGRALKSKGDWTALTGCVSGTVICACATVRNRRRVR